MGYRTVSVEVSLCEFSDDELVEEVRERGLQGRCHQHPETHEDVDAERLAADVQGSLMTKRYDRAMTEMRQLLAALLPPSVAAAFEAMKDGRYDEAICDLDDFMEPPPSVMAKTLPKASLESAPN